MTELIICGQNILIYPFHIINGFTVKCLTGFDYIISNYDIREYNIVSILKYD